MTRPAVPVSESARHRGPVAPALAGGLLALTAAVAAGWWPVSLDHRLAGAMPGRHAAGLAAGLLRVASGVTTLATPQTTVVITVAVAAWLAWRDTSRAPLRTVARPLVALAVTVLAGKALLHRPGPPGSRLHHVLGYFPSGHTATAVVGAGLLARLVIARRPALRVVLLAAASTWALLVGASLVVDRYHWLSDVVAGLLLGGLVLHLTRPPQPDPAPQAAVTAGRT